VKTDRRSDSQTVIGKHRQTESGKHTARMKERKDERERGSEREKRGGMRDRKIDRQTDRALTKHEKGKVWVKKNSMHVVY
jgi:hypothetical protein